MGAEGGRGSTEWVAKWCTESATARNTGLSRGALRRWTPHTVLLAGGRQDTVGQPQRPQRGPPAQLRKLLFLGLKLTFSDHNQL